MYSHLMTDMCISRRKTAFVNSALNRCIAQEIEMQETGCNSVTIDPDTFYGDARALLKHPGFPEYKGPPLQSELTMRLKIEPRLLKSSTGQCPQ
jgi:hypothetical protein